MQEWVANPEPGVIFQEDTLLAALIPATALQEWDSSAESLAEKIEQEKIPRRECSFPVFEHPHHIIQYHLEFLAANLSHRIECDKYEQAMTGLFLGPGATIDSTATIDTSEGIIVLERDAQVGPHTHLQGPLPVSYTHLTLPTICSV